MNEKKILAKKEIEIGGRKAEIILIECDTNQTGYRGQRLQAHFIDKPEINIKFNKITNSASIGRKILTSEQIKKLRAIVDSIQDEEVYD